jgi:molecular chaperone GrpE
MAEEDLRQHVNGIEDEFEIEPDEGEEDLESAMQEALKAVERVGDHSRGEGRQSQTAQVGSQSTTDGEIEQLQQEIVELRDRSARTLADFENFRKRVERERQDERRFAAFEILGEFLGVIDNLERALASNGPADDLKVGVELIQRQMLDLMKNAGVARIDALGQEFDPRFHEAVAHHEDADVAVPTVAEELQAGYLMHDRLLRPSVVKVAMPAEPDSENLNGNG